MEHYIPLKDYAKHMKIETGDTVFVSSDARKLVWDAVSRHQDADLNHFIDGLIEAVGAFGTVIFPTYNWDFCGGKAFNIETTPCKTGALGALALKRDDFARTCHPIYSFAVHGKYSDELLSMSNTDSFGKDSPFAFFHAHNVKNYIIDVSLQNCLTFVHYVEESSGYVHHRFVKDFTARCIDRDGTESKRTYSMFVRDLERDVETTIDPIEPDLLASGAEELLHINASKIKLLYLGKAYDVILKDITENRSRKLCKYKGQED